MLNVAARTPEEGRLLCHSVYGNLCKACENQPDSGAVGGLPATLEECLDALSILLKTQAAKPKRRL